MTVLAFVGILFSFRVFWQRKSPSKLINPFLDGSIVQHGYAMDSNFGNAKLLCLSR